MFPGPSRKRTRRVWDKNAPADKNRRDILHCWKDCTLCSPTLMEQRHKDPRFRIYRLCTRPDRQIEERCFESSVICERANVPRKEVAPMSSDRGWDDY